MCTPLNRWALIKRALFLCAGPPPESVQPAPIPMVRDREQLGQQGGFAADRSNQGGGQARLEHPAVGGLQGILAPGRGESGEPGALGLAVARGRQNRLLIGGRVRGGADIDPLEQGVERCCGVDVFLVDPVWVAAILHGGVVTVQVSVGVASV
jgi:hypothetical protein